MADRKPESRHVELDVPVSELHFYATLVSPSCFRFVALELNAARPLWSLLLRCRCAVYCNDNLLERLFDNVVPAFGLDVLFLHMRWRAVRGPTSHFKQQRIARLTLTFELYYLYYITQGTKTTNSLISWLYLIFFNGLWVVFPVWILWEAYQAMSSAMSQAEMVDLVNYLKKDD